MTSWDKIYKNHQQGGEAWATLSEEIDVRFISLLENHDFAIKKALDIGCGTGKYLSFLESKNFIADAIDSSPTAVVMTREKASSNSKIEVADMYEFSYPENTYDLILSVSTLHHGYKKQITNTIQDIYKSLIKGGVVFITLPNLESSNKWDTFKNHTELEPGVYSPNSGPEVGLPHAFFTKQEVINLFSKFNNLTIDLDKIGRWFIIGKK